MKQVMTISGSLAARSSNKNVIEHIARLSAGRCAIVGFDGIRHLPQFNPDLDSEEPPTAVSTFRQAIKESDGILISTPEYIFGVPGALKNALDWTVSSADFRLKPTALIVSSTSGEKAYQSLILTLQTIEAVISDGCSLLISHVKAKVGPDGKISDERTLIELKTLTESFMQALQA
jgi:NAD(P)H-dependent FMN reductase